MHQSDLGQAEPQVAILPGLSDATRVVGVFQAPGVSYQVVAHVLEQTLALEYVDLDALDALGVVDVRGGAAAHGAHDAPERHHVRWCYKMDQPP